MAVEQAGGDRPWPPSAPLAAMQARARLLAAVRAFFAAHGVLEVETPLLSHAIGSDPQLQPISARCQAGGKTITGYLQTSPEFAMKRLLAAGSGPIFQICKAFRDGEAGGRHNPEFSLLEWYRTDFDDQRLMDEVEALLRSCCDAPAFERLRYRVLFREHLGIDPLRCELNELRALAQEQLELGFDSDDKDLWLDLLFSHLIEPTLQSPVFIYDYPPSQAALARLDRDAEGDLVARRFELVMGGMEIANGYYELCDAEEQAARFAADQQRRQALGLLCYPVDEALLAALRAGLPDCAGVALGLDRLLMWQLGTRRIDQVLAFPFPRA